MKSYFLLPLILLVVLCSCSEKKYNGTSDQSAWIELYDHVTLTEDFNAIRNKFPTITDWAREEKDQKVYVWTKQTIFNTEAYVAFIFQSQMLYQVKIYLSGLTDESSKEIFLSIKDIYTNAIKSEKMFCNNSGTREDACFWLLESMTVYVKYLDDDKAKILFGFQKR